MPLAKARRAGHAQPGSKPQRCSVGVQTLLKFKIRLLHAVAALALAVRLSALRLVRPPAARRLYTRSLSIAMSKRAGDFDEAEATKAAKKLKVAELRAALEAAGADTKGLKAALVARLVEVKREAAQKG